MNLTRKLTTIDRRKTTEFESNRIPNFMTVTNDDDNGSVSPICVNVTQFVQYNYYRSVPYHTKSIATPIRMNFKHNTNNVDPSTLLVY